jgi:hypothetical protein
MTALLPNSRKQGRKVAENALINRPDRPVQAGCHSTLAMAFVG